MDSDDIALFSYLIAVGFLLFRGPEIGPLKIADMFIVISISLYLFRRDFQVQFPKSVFLLFGGFLITLVISTALSPIVILSSTILELLRYILCMCLFLMTFDYISTNAISFKRVRRVYILATIVSSCLSVIGFGLFLLGIRHDILLDQIHWTASPRMMLLYYDPNHYASVLLIGYTFLFHELFEYINQRDLIHSLGVITAFGLIGGAIVTTGSRTGLASMVGVSVFVAGMKLLQLRGSRVLLEGGVAIIGFLTVLTGFRTDLFSVLTLGIRSGTISEGLQLRFSLWRAASQTWYQNPILGVGPNNFVHYIPRLAETVDPKITAFPHNTYLGLLSETGLIGAVFGFGIVWRHISIGVRQIWQTPDDEIIVAFGVLVALLVVAFFLDIFDSRRLWFAFGIISAILSRESQMPK